MTNLADVLHKLVAACGALADDAEREAHDIIDHHFNLEPPAEEASPAV